MVSGPEYVDIRPVRRRQLLDAARVLNITHPYVSDSGRWEASWTGGGSAVADIQDELLADVTARLGPA